MSLPQPSQRPAGVDLSARIGGLSLANPIIAASGTFGYGVEFADIVNLNCLGGIVVKGLSAEPMAGAPAPRLCETRGGMINAVGLQNIGVLRFRDEKLPQLRRYSPAIIANVFGQSVAEYVEVIEALEGAEGLAAYELNISCPNVERGDAEFASDPGPTASVVSAARKTTKRPVWVKLAPYPALVVRVAQAAEAAGADALTIANTYPAMRIDIRTRRPKLGNLTGGLSGPAIKPITMRMVFEVSRCVSIPVIGLGGIENAEDIVEYMLAGASAVQVGTAHFVDPRASEGLVGGLRRLLSELSIFSIRDIAS